VIKGQEIEVGMVKKGSWSENAKERQSKFNEEVAKCGGKFNINRGVDKQQKSKMIMGTVALATQNNKIKSPKHKTIKTIYKNRKPPR
jgi:hypothetical protein